MDLDDKLFHYILVGSSLLAGSFLKYMWDKLMEKFWDKEWNVLKKLWRK